MIFFFFQNEDNKSLHDGCIKFHFFSFFTNYILDTAYKIFNSLCKIIKKKILENDLDNFHKNEKNKH